MYPLTYIIKSAKYPFVQRERRCILRLPLINVRGTLLRNGVAVAVPFICDILQTATAPAPTIYAAWPWSY